MITAGTDNLLSASVATAFGTGWTTVDTGATGAVDGAGRWMVRGHLTRRDRFGYWHGHIRTGGDHIRVRCDGFGNRRRDGVVGLGVRGNRSLSVSRRRDVAGPVPSN
jgi:hypothetical protein